MHEAFLFIFTTLASTQSFLLISVVIGSVLFLKRGSKVAGIFLGSVLGLSLSVVVLKNVFAAPRPSDALIEIASYAFPSGHAAGIIFLAITFAYLSHHVSNPIRYSVYVGLFILTCVIGLSRIYLNVHTPMQVAAGYAVGAVWGLAWVFCAEKIRRTASIT